MKLREVLQAAAPGVRVEVSAREHGGGCRADVLVGAPADAAPLPLHVSHDSLRGIWIEVSVPFADSAKEISRS